MFNFTPHVTKGLKTNRSGGKSFEVNAWTQLQRVLILGTAGGTYYVSERDLTQDAIAVVDACLKADGPRAVQMAVDVSVAGRAPKNDYAVYVLARASVVGDEATRKAANDAMTRVCRTGTHLFQWVSLVKAMGKGFSYGRRRAVKSWYFDRSPKDLAYQVMKYRQRKVNGQSWTHRDVMRLVRPKVKGDSYRTLTHWMVHGWEGVGEAPHPDEALVRIWAFERLKAVTSIEEACRLIRTYRLPRECVPTQWFGHAKAVKIWEALFEQGMPYTALMRNLGNMSRAGFLTKGSSNVREVNKLLTNAETIRRARVHPFNVLVALKTYEAGQGVRGSNTWTPVKSTVGALDKAFYASFGNVPDTGKRWLIGLDVSGSMTWSNLMNVPGLTPRVASSAMAMIFARTQSKCDLMAFTHELVPINITPNDRLQDVVRKTDRLPFGATDCSLPMIYAKKQWKKHKKGYDGFVVYTDNDTNSNRKPPSQELQSYRKQSGINAKLIVQAMTADRFTIADPNDPGMLDMCGLDAAAPRIIADFVSETI